MTEPKTARCDTLVTLRDHIETRLAAQQMAVDNAKQLMEARMASAELTLERRLDLLNHLRESVVTKGEFAATHAALIAEFRGDMTSLRAEIAGLKEWKAEQSGKASMSAVYIAYVLAALGLVISATTLMHEMIG